MIYRKTNFISSLTAQWAAFFDLAGWTWTYHPRVRGAQPQFKVEFPCGHSECGSTHKLYVMVRPFSKLSEFCGTSAMMFENDHFYGDGLDVDAIALFGNHPNVTGWAMAHGAGGSGWGEDETGLSAGDSVGIWVGTDANRLWDLAAERIKTPLMARIVHVAREIKRKICRKYTKRRLPHLRNAGLATTETNFTNIDCGTF